MKKNEQKLKIEYRLGSTLENGIFIVSADDSNIKGEGTTIEEAIKDYEKKSIKTKCA